MQELTASQKARIAIRELKTIIDALTIRGFYRPSGKFGKDVEGCLRDLNPEIYGSMNDSKIVELKGLEYVIDRLPKGIEQCVRIILTEEDQFGSTPFEAIQPLKRRRISYLINKNEICFIISRGISEIYDIITHMTFLNIEAKKIYRRIQDDTGKTRIEWDLLEKIALSKNKLNTKQLDSALWNLSIILGRSYHETREVFESLENNKKKNKSNNGLFKLIYNLGKRVENEKKSREDSLVIYFTPSLMSIIGHQQYGKIWAQTIRDKFIELELYNRPVHIISSNPHSVINVLYAYDALKGKADTEKTPGLYNFFSLIKDKKKEIIDFAEKHGLVRLPDKSGANIDCQIIDTSKLSSLKFHPELEFNIFNSRGNGRSSAGKNTSPVILVMDYAFGTQAFELMERLLKIFAGDKNNIEDKEYSVEGSKKDNIKNKKKDNQTNNQENNNQENNIQENNIQENNIQENNIQENNIQENNIQENNIQENNIQENNIIDKKTIIFDIMSISIMGKAGILAGEKGDIMLSSAYVCEGTSDNYIVENELRAEDFDDDVNVFTGPMATVLGTSLQNRDVLEMFQKDWNAIGLEMEGGYYQKAVSAAIIKGYLPKDIKMRYAYYASDNPMTTGNTLASGPMGEEGIKPTYMITKAILEKIAKP